MKTIAIVLTLAVSCQVALAWNQTLRDYIQNMHNEVRRNVGACQMNKLEYDMDLEHQAERWLANCRFEHEMIDGRGENLAWSSHHDSEETMIKDAMDAWYDEINMYTYGQRSCSMSCHYTQLVWSTVQKMGCTAMRCANLVNAGPDSWFLGCFYTPQGNWNGEVPYKKTCDKPCLEGQTQENGLCVGEPKGEDSTEKKCADESARCEGWAKKSQCEKNPSYMNKHCPVSCNICEGEKFKAPENAPACSDEDSGCPGWAKNGLCTKNPGYMGNHCKKSCHKC